MADLDEFFAKKDRKKSKSRPNFILTRELVQNLEALAKREAVAEKPDMASGCTISTGSDNAIIAQQQSPVEEQMTEDEWEEFDEKHRMEYIGVKFIQKKKNLGKTHAEVAKILDEEAKREAAAAKEKMAFDSLTSNDGGNTVEEQKLEINDDVKVSTGCGEKEVETNNAECFNGQNPWKKVIQMDIEKTSEKYVPPALRQRQREVLPDIANAELFPVLGVVKGNEKTKQKNELTFEEVVRGGQTQGIKELSAAATRF